MKVAIYCRVSTNKQDNGNQIDDLKRFIGTQQGWELVLEFVDVVTGSGKKDRAQFDAMMLAASQRKFDLLLFWKLDRLTREGTRKTFEYLSRLEKWGVKWRSYMEPIFDSCGQFRDIVISIMSTLAEQERIAISDRTKAGLARARAKGKILGALPKFVDLTDLADRRDQGHSVRKIAADLKISTGLVMKKLKELERRKTDGNSSSSSK